MTENYLVCCSERNFLELTAALRPLQGSEDWFILNF